MGYECTGKGDDTSRGGLTRALVLGLLGSLMLAGCARTKPSTSQAPAAEPNVLVAYTSCALVPAIEGVRARFEAANPGKTVKIEGGEPVALVHKLEGGASADLFICLGRSEFGLLEREGLLESSSRRELGNYKIVLAIPEKKPPLASAKDLTSARVRSIVMAAPGVTSLGTDGKHALDRLGLWSHLQDKLVLRATPLEAAQSLAKGEADAGILYDPCPLLGLPEKIPPHAVTLGPSLSAPGERPVCIEIGVQKRSQKWGLAQQFIAFLRGPQARADLAAAGIPVEEKPGGEPAPANP
jgi:molybdate transport system substrate-binding protein